MSTFACYFTRISNIIIFLAIFRYQTSSSITINAKNEKKTSNIKTVYNLQLGESGIRAITNPIDLLWRNEFNGYFRVPEPKGNFDQYLCNSLLILVETTIFKQVIDLYDAMLLSEKFYIAQMTSRSRFCIESVQY